MSGFELGVYNVHSLFFDDKPDLLLAVPLFLFALNFRLQVRRFCPCPAKCWCNYIPKISIVHISSVCVCSQPRWWDLPGPVLPADRLLYFRGSSRNGFSGGEHPSGQAGSGHLRRRLWEVWTARLGCSLKVRVYSSFFFSPLWYQFHVQWATENQLLTTNIYYNWLPYLDILMHIITEIPEASKVLVRVTWFVFFFFFLVVLATWCPKTRGSRCPKRTWPEQRWSPSPTTSAPSPGCVLSMRSVMGFVCLVSVCISQVVFKKGLFKVELSVEKSNSPHRRPRWSFSSLRSASLRCCLVASWSSSIVQGYEGGEDLSCTIFIYYKDDKENI